MAHVDAGGSFSGRERHVCFLNTQGQRFANVSAPTGFDLSDDGRAMGLTDWDHDGDLDVWIANRTAPRLRLLQNSIQQSTSQGERPNWVAVRLRGVDCNRDAIGGRVELYLQGVEQPLIRTVRAGDGVLAQSSKWLLFGLGQSEIQRVRVRWPDGATSSFDDLAAGRRYVVTQHAGAKPQDESSATPLTGGVLAANERPEEGRIVMPQRVLVPPLTFRGEEKQEVTWTDVDHGAGPLLITLWASWCRPCLSELADLSNRYDELQQAGLRVTAVNLDPLSARAKGAFDLRAFHRRQDVPFLSVSVDASWYDQLALVYGNVFHDQRDFPVPMSLLIDRDRWLTVVYRGPISVDQLLDDLELFQLAPPEYSRRAWPLKGRWIRQPLRPSQGRGSPSWIATAMEIAGHEQQAVDYWSSYTDYYAKFPRPADLDERASWDEALAGILGTQAARILTVAGEFEAGLRAAEGALRLDPRNDSIRINAGMLKEKTGDFLGALETYRSLADGSSELQIPANARIALILAAAPDASLRDGREAVRIGERIVTRGGGFDAVDAIAAGYAELDEFGKAVRAAERGLEIAKRSQDETAMKRFSERLRLYRQRIKYRLAKPTELPR